MHGVRDVSVGGGLMATIGKGFSMHVVLAPQPDGVWLLESSETSGVARVALLFHPSMRFKQRSEGCRLYTDEAEAVAKK